MKNKHQGSNFDDFLDEEGILTECEQEAIDRKEAHEHINGLSKEEFQALFNEVDDWMDGKMVNMKIGPFEILYTPIIIYGLNRSTERYIV